MVTSLFEPLKSYCTQIPERAYSYSKKLEFVMKTGGKWSVTETGGKWSVCIQYTPPPHSPPPPPPPPPPLALTTCRSKYALTSLTKLKNLKLQMDVCLCDSNFLDMCIWHKVSCGYYCALTLMHSERPKLYTINPNALRKAKIVYNFGFSECIRVKSL